jgi:hypothetical protein
MVSPELYIGIGLSGELQHSVGLGDPKVMVAINNDPKSPVFEQVDYGIVEDHREFVSILIEKLKQLRENNTSVDSIKSYRSHDSFTTFISNSSQYALFITPISSSIVS